MNGVQDGIVKNVVNKFVQRSKLGISKYGTTLQNHNNTSPDYWLNHLQEELMDAVNYIEKLKSVTLDKEEDDGYDSDYEDELEDENNDYQDDQVEDDGYNSDYENDDSDYQYDPAEDDDDDSGYDDDEEDDDEEEYYKKGGVLDWLLTLCGF